MARLHAGLEQQDAAAEAVDAKDGDERGEHVDGADDDGAQQGGGLAAAQRAEQDGAVEDDLCSGAQGSFSSRQSCLRRRLTPSPLSPHKHQMRLWRLTGSFVQFDS